MLPHSIVFYIFDALIIIAHCFSLLWSIIGVLKNARYFINTFMEYSKYMKYIVIKPPRDIVDIESYVITEIQKALEATKDLVVLDLGHDFIYNSRILSTTLVHRKRIVIVSPNERFKTLVKILNADHLICVVSTIEEFLSSCPMVDCASCPKNKDKDNSKISINI